MPVQEARYESSKRGDPSKLYGWDPRPIRYRKASNILMNNFVRDMQGINSKGTSSIWETVLKVKHEDFEIDAEEKRVLIEQCQQFETHLLENTKIICGDNNASQIPGSELQRDSDVWMNSRWPLITASDSKAVRNMGAKLITGKGKLVQIYTYLCRKLWVNNIIATSDMLYGIREEVSARLKYTEETNLDLVECGLFINKHYPYLGASPDGSNYGKWGCSWDC